jgi:hypothetical protein
MMTRQRACEIVFAHTGEGDVFEPAEDEMQLVEAAELLEETGLIWTLPGRVGRAVRDILDSEEV